MAAILKRMFALLAIYTIALQGVLAGPSFLAHAFAADPAAVICHTDSGDTGPLQPAHNGHDHCVLCGVTAAADTPTVAPLGEPLARPTDVLRPNEPAASVVRHAHPQRARAPPRLV